jgi:hypothetical protein
MKIFTMCMTYDIGIYDTKNNNCYAEEHIPVGKLCIPLYVKSTLKIPHRSTLKYMYMKILKSLGQNNVTIEYCIKFKAIHRDILKLYGILCPHRL